MLASTLGKPESYVMVRLSQGEVMSFAGSTAPCALLRVLSIGKLGLEENRAHSAALFAFLQEKLGVPNDRAYIVFADEARQDIGYKGNTFAPTS